MGSHQRWKFTLEETVHDALEKYHQNIQHLIQNLNNYNKYKI